MNKLRYFYRIDQFGKPIPGTLERYVTRPRTGRWGEITKTDYERKPCCGIEPGSAILGITGPTGILATGASSYNIVINSSVTGVSDNQVDNISLYINNIFIELQEGNNFHYEYEDTAKDPEEETVYYTVAVLKDGTTIISPILQFTLTNTIPTWTGIQQLQIAGIGQTRHICDLVVDVDLDTIAVTFTDLPAFCTTNLIPVPGIATSSLPALQNGVIVDITVAPTSGQEGTYTFYMNADDGVSVVTKTVTLVVDATTHHIHSVRNTPTTVTVPGDGNLQNVGSVTYSTIINGQQLWNTPSNGMASTFPAGPGAVTLQLSSTIGGRKVVNIYQSRNGTTGTGGRYEDALYIIINFT